MGSALASDTCYRALVARDARFDGTFFVGVATTGIYCRPICTARTPREERCSFYRTAAEAEHAGFRACFRCRPELAPGCAPLDSVPRLVAAALARIDEGYLDSSSLEDLAASLGVTSRHLRRAIEEELGVPPVELAGVRRLARAKQLLHDTQLGLAEVAFASGFGSVRRFNAAFRDRFGAPPSSVRRDAPRSGDIVLRLEHRPPLDWDAMLAFLSARALPGVETIADGTYARVVREGDVTGLVRVRRESERSLVAEVPIALARSLPRIATRLRRLFDLDAHPEAIAECLVRDRRLAKSVRRRPGLRVPGAFDPFEMAVRAVLGQQVTVRAATTLAGRLVAAWGVFPSAAELTAMGSGEIVKIGMPGKRAAAVAALAAAVQSGAIDLGVGEGTIERLAALPGLGPWTAQYVAMRALRWPDAFPSGDLGVRKALGGVTAAEAERRAERWRPWRAYAVMHLWTEGE